MAEPDSYLLTSPTETALRRDPDEHTWKPLRFLNLYRLTLGALFSVLFVAGHMPSPLGATYPGLFYSVSLFFVLFAIVAEVAIGRRAPDFLTQVYVQLGADIVAITLFIHASGGMDSGLGVLMVVSIASAGMFTQGRTAIFFAALATMALLLEQGYDDLKGLSGLVSYPRAGILGATLFATALLSRALSLRIRESEALATQRGIDLANISRLTEYVIQQLESGVLVVDNDRHIRLMNGAAWRLLGRPSTMEQRTLESVSPDLSARLAYWMQHPGGSPQTLHGDDDSEFLLRFVRIGEQHPAGFLIFLENATVAAHHAQSLKLAALGRLTASIAHEVRNPLGAISHAGELLSESENLDRADRRLTEIIGQQVQRVNTIIESILQLGRRDRSQPLVLELKPWLDQFLQEYSQTSGLKEESIGLQVEPANLRVRFDPNHLHQILWNLCQNACHHSRAADAISAKVRVLARLERGRSFLDVIDAGPGVPDEVKPHLFEPFFTTGRHGTGLGLYISRELAQCNAARLEYFPAPGVPGRFRLSFGPFEPNGS